MCLVVVLGVLISLRYLTVGSVRACCGALVSLGPQTFFIIILGNTEIYIYYTSTNNVGSETVPHTILPLLYSGSTHIHTVIYKD